MAVDSEGNRLSIGDRVITVGEHGFDGNENTIGVPGTIRSISDGGWVGVEFDEYIDGHSLLGLAKDGYGFGGYSSQLRLWRESQDVEIVITIDDVFGLIQ